MNKPPDFVMYVIMVKKGDKFEPCWQETFIGTGAFGYAKKADAQKTLRGYRLTYGKKNAYLQQYGPYS